MVGSWTIRVLKRDGKAEAFDRLKLASTIWRAMGDAGDSYLKAVYLSDAVEFYLGREYRGCASSAAVFEMCVKLLQHVELPAAAMRLQAHWAWRQARRREIRVRHERGKITLWDKSWLADFAQRSWHILPRTARILSGQVETQLLKSVATEVARELIIGQLNELVSAFGLADAVPV